MENYRCPWAQNNEWNRHYHDTEWGVPLHDDKNLFEFLVLDTFQAGLSWLTILKKRENFRLAFADFDAHRIAVFSEDDVFRLMQNDGIIRNQLKIKATITNAKAFLEVQKKYGSFDAYIWQFTDNKVIINHWKEQSQVPASSKESDAMSKSMKKHGFKFVGTTICYAFMQAAGMINDHVSDCFRFNEIIRKQ
jgi:DNA-3-methyladenine glycosylase I